MSGNNAQIEKGQGVVGLFDSLYSIVNDFAITLILGAAVLWFLYLGLKYMWLLREGKGTDEIKAQLPWAIVILTVMFSVYALIKLMANVFNLSIS